MAIVKIGGDYPNKTSRAAVRWVQMVRRNRSVFVVCEGSEHRTRPPGGGAIVLLADLMLSVH